MTPALEWFKSSCSSNDGPDCIEVAMTLAPTTIHARDSKHRLGTRLTFTGDSWSRFLAYLSGQPRGD